MRSKRISTKPASGTLMQNSYILQLLHLRRRPTTLLSHPPLPNKPVPSKPDLSCQFHLHLLFFSLL
ncbi:hypothetical protein OIU77_018080 [Salix suchowensis]|uniref:Uncharacterized protein n=1 Tax=Salix suchowensis TaxID=1278906 RepID=A0ABQ8ZRG3_9ROSI|nr:hypothetical protein OIU77_018080 [Salix suchowensis]